MVPAVICDKIFNVYKRLFKRKYLLPQCFAKPWSLKILYISPSKYMYFMLDHLVTAAALRAYTLYGGFCGLFDILKDKTILRLTGSEFADANTHM